jgi:hypothetical protein
MPNYETTGSRLLTMRRVTTVRVLALQAAETPVRVSHGATALLARCRETLRHSSTGNGKLAATVRVLARQAAETPARVSHGAMTLLARCRENLRHSSTGNGKLAGY